MEGEEANTLKKEDAKNLLQFARLWRYFMVGMRSSSIITSLLVVVKWRKMLSSEALEETVPFKYKQAYRPL